MSTPVTVRTFHIVQRQGSDDIRLHGEIRVMLNKVFDLCDIKGNFHVSLCAFSDDTLPKRTIKFRTCDSRAIRSRCRGDKSQTWNIDIVGPDLPNVFDKLAKNSLNGQRFFEFNRDFEIKSIETPPAVVVPPPKVSIPPENDIVPEEPKERFSITRNPENLVLALSYIAEACDPKGNISFKGICQVINTNFAEDGQEISEAKIRPAVSGLFVDKGYLKVTRTQPTIYTVTPSGIILLEQNSMLRPEVKAKFSPEVKKVFTPSVTVAVPNPQSGGQLETKLAELQAQIGRRDQLQAEGAHLVERRNTILARKETLLRELADIPEQLKRVEAEIGETTKQIQGLAAAQERYDQIMRLLVP